jgi:hypothetical protein
MSLITGADEAGVPGIFAELGSRRRMGPTVGGLRSSGSKEINKHVSGRGVALARGACLQDLSFLLD